MRQWRSKNKDRINQYRLKYNSENKEQRSNGYKAWAVKNREELLRKKREYANRRYALGFRWKPKTEDQRRRISARGTRRFLERRKADIQYRILTNLRNRISSCVSTGRFGETTKQLLGCSLSYFKDHLERQFTGGMSFENYGKLWEIDHIVECAKFNMESEQDRNACFHYTNLRPLKCSVNRSRSATVRKKNA